MRQKNYSPTGFTLSDNDRAILKREMMATGKTRSEIIREYIADIGKKQSQNNKGPGSLQLPGPLCCFKVIQSLTRVIKTN